MNTKNQIKDLFDLYFSETTNMLISYCFTMLFVNSLAPASFCGIVTDNATCSGAETNLLFSARRIVAAASTENSITAPDVTPGRKTAARNSR